MNEELVGESDAYGQVSFSVSYLRTIYTVAALGGSTACRRAAINSTHQTVPKAPIPSGVSSWYVSRISHSTVPSSIL